MRGSNFKKVCDFKGCNKTVYKNNVFCSSCRRKMGYYDHKVAVDRRIDYVFRNVQALDRFIMEDSIEGVA